MRRASATRRSQESAALTRELAPSSLLAARRALLAAIGLAVIGAAFGLLVAAPLGAVRGPGLWLVAACLLFSSTLMGLLLTWPLDRLAPLAVSATAFFAAYLAALSVYAVFDSPSRDVFLVGLIWFFPLMAFNKIVNRGRAARNLAWILLATPLLLTVLLWPWIARLFPSELLGIVIVCCLALIATAVMLDVLWRYREAFIDEAERAENSRFAAEILESISESFVLVDRGFRLLYVNRSARAALGLSAPRAAGATLGEIDSPFASPGIVQALRAAWAGAGPRRFEGEAGGVLYDVRCTPGDKEMSIYFQDVTEQRAAQAALRDGARRLAEQAEVLDKANDIIIVRDIPGRILYWNESAVRTLGVSAADAVGRPIHEVLGVDPALIDEATEQVLAHGEWRRVIRQAGRGGETFVLDGHLCLIRDEAGAPKSILSISADITARVAIEERLRQAEQLKAVGQLTGGVAHDFNNLLTVILGSTEALNEALPDREDLLALGEMTRRAAERGAALTHRLLAFAQQQALDPRVIDPRSFLPDADALLRRALREDISLATEVAEDVWRVTVDPAQLESALLNLCLNARDAMPEGGCLTMEAANVTLDDTYASTRLDVTPGDYVLITITDDGAGISPENIAKVFDPFFTTKPFGKGTGLGLSMVHGFVKQSSGHIAVYSELGHGTSVKMYLPRALDPAGPDTAPTPDGDALQGAETILVVEDDELVRASVRRQLTGLGYRVMTTANGLEALEVIRTGARIDLLFTDVIMPGGLNGPALVLAARAIFPSLRVLYTSGYTENAIVHQGRLDAGIQLLSKPYARAELARKVRDVLTRPH
jgi:PAS domain S-box-containing protein